MFREDVLQLNNLRRVKGVPVKRKKKKERTFFFAIVPHPLSVQLR